MRMKDSDDYITARAANPRTGLISPSVPATTPRSPGTPGSPGSSAEALQLLRPQDDVSPTVAATKRSRPLLSRANEGRKLFSGSRLPKTAWFTEPHMSAAASPRVTDLNSNVAKTRPRPVGPRVRGLKDDQFVMNMPSAAEPQPWENPGLSAVQIQALEHYRGKSRRTSAEGYDQRLVYGGPRGVRKTSAGNVPVGRRISPGHGGALEKFEKATRALKACDGNAVLAPLNAGNRAFAIGKESWCRGEDGQELGPATFAPFSSPRTPVARRETETKYTAMRTMPGGFDGTVSPSTEELAMVVTRKPVGGGPAPVSRRVSNRSPSPGFREQSLSQQLPRVRLVHSAQASKPKYLAQATTGAMQRRACSLGCTQDPSTSACAPSSRAAIPTPYPRWSLFGTSPANSISPRSKDSTPQGLDFLLSTFLVCGAALVLLTGQIQLPHLGLLEALRTPNASPQQKVEALKTLFALCGQVLVVLLVLTVVVQLGSLIVRVVGVVLWPVRVIWWGLGGG